MLEHDLLVLRQDLQATAQKQMSKGGTFSMETLGKAGLVGQIMKHFSQLTRRNFPAIETELREVQQRATELQKKAKRLNDEVDQIIRQKSRANVQINRAVNRQLDEENREDLRKLLEQQANIEMEVSKEEKCKTNSRNDGETTPSDDSETEKKYLELIDLLTVKMFEDQPETNHGKTRPSKKSSSLPRTLDMSLQSGLQSGVQQVQKSSSQHFSGSGLTAYERLFGKPRPGQGGGRREEMTLKLSHNFREPTLQSWWCQYKSEQRQEEDPGFHPPGQVQIP